MSKRAFVIHGWGGSPNKDLMPWIQSQLKDEGYEVVVPFMPDTEKPTIGKWVDKLREVIGIPRKDDVLVGHSVGCQAILRLLEGVEPIEKINKVILIAPWFTLTNLENNEAWKIADPWFKTPINFTEVKNKANSFTAIFSDNDGWVPLEENRAMFKEKLNPEIIVLSKKGHFSEEEGVKELPEILNLL